MAKGNRNNDPATDANRRILSDIQQREAVKETEKAAGFDLGLNLKQPESKADSAIEFLRDEWDRKTFGELPPTYTRILYGPDPLLDSCPGMKAAIERIGLEEYANTAAETLLLKEENAFPDSLMKKGVRSAIARFGKEQVADAIRKRILSIPSREVEIEADRSEVEIYGQPMEEAVARYGTVGMAPKFLSERCISVLGLRGYVIVKDEHGEPVKVGTLIMGEIPIRRAEARRRHYADESESNVQSMQESFEDEAAKAIRDGKRSGISVLQRGESVHSNAAGDLDTEDLTRSYLGRERTTGFSIDRQV